MNVLDPVRDAQEIEAQASAQASWRRYADRIDWDTRRPGTIIQDVDMSRPTEEMFERVILGYLTHSIIVIKNQSVPPEAQLEFTKRFGPIRVSLHDEYAMKGTPQLTFISNIVNEDNKPIGHDPLDVGWHADGSPFERPAGTIVLQAIEVPAEGGDTIFADLSAAYEALDPARKEELKDLKAIHRYRFLFNDSSRENAKARNPDAVHPVVRTHLTTGRHALLTGEKDSAVALGMPEEQGAALMRDLLAYAIQPRFQYRHKWEPGDILIWDNRVTMHTATPFDKQKYRRLLHRTTTYSERPF